MGFTNEKENLRRLKKYNEDHLANVCEDYIREPIAEAEPPKHSQVGQSAPEVKPSDTLNTLL